MHNNVITGLFILLALNWVATMSMVIIIFEGKRHKKKRHGKHPRLKLRIFFQNKIKHFFMASINSITLTDALAHTGLITVTDDAGNNYTGTLANVAVTVADPTQDTAVVDPTTPNTIDVQEKNPTGGTTAVVTADFTSQGNATLIAGSTAQAIPDGAVFPGLTCQVIMINKVSTQLKLQVSF